MLHITSQTFFLMSFRPMICDSEQCSKLSYRKNATFSLTMTVVNAAIYKYKRSTPTEV